MNAFVAHITMVFSYFADHALAIQARCSSQSKARFCLAAMPYKLTVSVDKVPASATGDMTELPSTNTEVQGPDAGSPSRIATVSIAAVSGCSSLLNSSQALRARFASPSCFAAR